MGAMKEQMLQESSSEKSHLPPEIRAIFIIFGADEELKRKALGAIDPLPKARAKSEGS